MLTVVPGGTTNMTALDLGLCGSPESILQQLKDSLLKQTSPVLLQRHVLCIEQAGAAKVYGMFFGVGLIARAVIFSQSRIKQLGITGEIYSGIITVGYLAGVLLGRRSGAWAPVQMAITERNIELHRGSFAFLFASTLDRLLFGMRPYWGQEQEPLHVTFVRQQRNAPCARCCSYFRAGGILNEKNGYHSCNTRVLELLIDDDYIVDGESYRAGRDNGPLRITAAGPITFLVAANANTGSMKCYKTSTPRQQLPEAFDLGNGFAESEAVSDDFIVLAEALKLRFGTSLEAILFMDHAFAPSEIGDGVADFYVVVSSYGEAYPEHYLRYLNAWLPPNVFYLEVERQKRNSAPSMRLFPWRTSSREPDVGFILTCGHVLPSLPDCSMRVMKSFADLFIKHWRMQS